MPESPLNEPTRHEDTHRQLEGGDILVAYETRSLTLIEGLLPACGTLAVFVPWWLIGFRVSVPQAARIPGACGK